MRISVVVITYNWPAALELALMALARQTEPPFEVIVTDDGSGRETRETMERMAIDYPCRLVHLWQPDDGARMSRARNRGIAAASGDYIVLLDGDMVAERHFVADHGRFAHRGAFIQGSRVLLDQAGSQRLMEQGETSVGFFTPGIERRRHTLRLPWLARLYARPSARTKGIKSCNMAFWRDDLVRVNGFNEAMTGWGREDLELAIRALHAGLSRRDVRFSALAWHLFHRSKKHDRLDNPNDAVVEATRHSGAVRCELGLDQHLAEFQTPPLALNGAQASRRS